MPNPNCSRCGGSGYGDGGTVNSFPCPKCSFEEPESCVECESTLVKKFQLVSVNGKDGVPAWICGDCGHTHLNPNHDDDCQGC